MYVCMYGPVAYTEGGDGWGGGLRPKGVPFSGFRYMRI